MMSRDSNVISRMRAITISREYGCGGGEIASRLASYLNWKLVDHEIVVQAARELDIPNAEAEAHDEYSAGIVGRILTNMNDISLAPLMVDNAQFTNIKTFCFLSKVLPFFLSSLTCF